MAVYIITDGQFDSSKMDDHEWLYGRSIRETGQKVFFWFFCADDAQGFTAIMRARDQGYTFPLSGNAGLRTDATTVVVDMATPPVAGTPAHDAVLAAESRGLPVVRWDSAQRT